MAILLEQAVDSLLAIGIARELDLTHLPADQVDDFMLEDTGQPSARGGIASVARLRGEGSQQCFLHGIFGELVRVQLSSRHPEQIISVLGEPCVGIKPIHPESLTVFRSEGAL